jgi:carbon-monoxide dehydrogenase large subunit
MNSSGNITNGIGQPVRRKEDYRLVTGRGCFADDVHLPVLAHAVIVRSPHAHAHIGSIDKAGALTSPGVLAVLTGHDYVADGLAPIPHGAGLMGRPDVVARIRGFEPITTQDYPMPPDTVRLVGEAVAMVVAETVDQAKDAAELRHGDSHAPTKSGGQHAAEAGAWRDNPSLRRKLGQGVRAPRFPSDCR